MKRSKSCLADAILPPQALFMACQPVPQTKLNATLFARIQGLPNALRELFIELSCAQNALLKARHQREIERLVWKSL
jgi:hypothetical protein